MFVCPHAPARYQQRTDKQQGNGVFPENNLDDLSAFDLVGPRYRVPVIRIQTGGTHFVSRVPRLGKARR